MENSKKNFELLKIFRLDVTLCLAEWDQHLMKTEVWLFVSFDSDLGSDYILHQAL